MLDIIVFIIFIALLVCFPYKKLYVWLDNHVEVWRLLGGIFLIFIGSIPALFISEDAEALSAGSDDITARMNLITGSFADLLGWVGMIVGFIMLLIEVWQALEKKKENESAPKK